MTDLILIPKGQRCFSFYYSIFFLTGKPSLLRRYIILKEMFNPVDAAENFREYLNLLFQEEDILPEIEITYCQEVFDI